MIVLDCSFALAMVMPEESRPASAPMLEEDLVVAPALWSFEVANAFRSAVRRGRVTEAEVLDMIAYLDTLEVAVAHPDEYAVRRSYMAAATHGLTPYDACYVDLAVQRGAELATLDSRLAQAARAVGVTALG